MSQTTHFRLLDLPRELRLHIYEALPTRTTHHVVELDSCLNPGHVVKFTYIRKSINGLPILATCSCIHREGSAIFKARMQALEKDPIRLKIFATPVWNETSLMDLLTSISLSKSTSDAVVALQSTLSLKRYARPGTYSGAAQPKREVHIALESSRLGGPLMFLAMDGYGLRTANSFLRIHSRSNFLFCLRHLLSSQEEPTDPLTPDQEQWLGDWEAEGNRVITIRDEIGGPEYEEEWAEGG